MLGMPKLKKTIPSEKGCRTRHPSVILPLPATSNFVGEPDGRSLLEEILPDQVVSQYRERFQTSMFLVR